jgi:hypothetical protein
MDGADFCLLAGEKTALTDSSDKPIKICNGNESILPGHRQTSHTEVPVWRAMMIIFCCRMHSISFEDTKKGAIP